MNAKNGSDAAANKTATGDAATSDAATGKIKTARLQVVLDDVRNYDIRVGQDLLGTFGTQLRQIAALSNTRQAVIITDSNVGPLYLEPLRQSLEAEEAGFEVFDIAIPAGETSKSIEVATEIWQALAMLGIGRDGLLIALGGGVVGDICGFVASTYMRGIAFVQVPTTLLAMVDSSVGGKTAVNLSAGKNIVGSFYQPLYVAADLGVLASLPQSEWQNGFAEIAKSALLDSLEFSNWLADNCEALTAHDPSITQQAIVRSVSFKAKVVAADEREAGARECLNYGHTFAHAIEAASGYNISHGKAVAEGMRFAARLAVEAIDADEGLLKAQDILLNKMKLDPIAESFSADELFKLMFGDKKVRNSELRFVFVERPGKWQVSATPADLVKIYLILWEQARM